MRPVHLRRLSFRLNYQIRRGSASSILRFINRICVKSGLSNAKFAQMPTAVAKVADAHIRMVAEVFCYNFYLAQILWSVEGAYY